MQEEEINTKGFWVFLVLLITVLGTGPFLTIFSLNALFGLQIAYSFSTWVAAWVLAGLLSGRGIFKKLLMLMGLGAIITKISNSFKKD